MNEYNIKDYEIFSSAISTTNKNVKVNMLTEWNDLVDKALKKKSN